MKITQIDVFQVSYNLNEKYAMSKDRFISSLVSTVVKISTDEGLNGFGEVCPLGSAYMEAYALGVPSGIQELGASLVGQDPRHIRDINNLMDLKMLGHSYIKSPIDIACWDILGQAAGLPIYSLLGGMHLKSFPLYRAIPMCSNEEMADIVTHFRSEGYRRFQLKVGGDPDDDISRIKKVIEALEPDDILVADANTGWLTHQAIRVVNEISTEKVYVEQPCVSLEECIVVRKNTQLPMVIDELIIGVNSLFRAYEKGVIDIANIKISRVGGLTKAVQIRNLCESLGIAMTIEDCWGGDVMTTAIAHVVASTQPEFYLSSTDFNSYVDLRLAEDAPYRKAGRLTVPTEPGLGIHVDERLLGNPVVTIK